jgi:hypothetical protein
MEAIEQTVINEVWRSIDGYINYQVSNIGRVRNCMTGKILKPYLAQPGYYKVALCDQGICKTFRIHQLVAQEFLHKPETDQRLEVDHLDRNKTNNQVSNLRYATKSQNGANAMKRPIATSTYRGVCWYDKRGKWTSQITANRKKYHLGYFENEHDAARAYNIKALELFGEFANLNEIEDD